MGREGTCVGGRSAVRTTEGEREALRREGRAGGGGGRFIEGHNAPCFVTRSSRRILSSIHLSWSSPPPPPNPLLPSSLPPVPPPCLPASLFPSLSPSLSLPSLSFPRARYRPDCSVSESHHPSALSQCQKPKLQPLLYTVSALNGARDCVRSLPEVQVLTRQRPIISHVSASISQVSAMVWHMSQP